MSPDEAGSVAGTINYQDRLNKESQSFDNIVSERSANNKIPDIRKNFFNPYFYNNIWRNGEFVRQHYGASVDWVVGHGFLHHLPPEALEEFVSLVNAKMGPGNILVGVEPRYDKISPQATMLVYALRRAWPNYFHYHGSPEGEMKIIADELGEAGKFQSELDNESSSELIVETIKNRFPQITLEYSNVFYDKVIGSLRVSRQDEIELSKLLSRLDDLIVKYSPEFGRRLRFCARR